MTDPSFFASNPDSPVAICTLSSPSLLAELVDSPIASRVAIIGPLETQNLGIERMLTSLIRQPRIRWLIVCGDEARGRYQGQAVFALFENGVDDQGAIIGARSRRARLQALSADIVDSARQQVRLNDLRGSHDLGAIASAVESCIESDPGPFTPNVSLPRVEPFAVPTRPFHLREHDPAGFFVILVDRDGNRLLVEHYGPAGELRHVLAGADAESLGVALEEWQLLTRLDHAAYMGRELTRAELALRHGFPYRQDAALT